MKNGLAFALVLAVLLLGSLMYWKTRPAEGAPPEWHAEPAAAVPESASVLSREADGSDRSAMGSQVARSAAAPVTSAAPPLESDLASSSEVSRAKKSAEETDKVFEKKYEGASAEARRKSRDSLRVLLYGDRKVEPGAQPALTDEQLQDSRREYEWLTQHP